MATDPWPPSGEQFEISFEDQKAAVAEVGATLREYSASGRRILDGFGRDEICSGGRGQVLAPWPNRIRAGIYEFRGRTHQLPLTETERQNAIHGLVRWVPWRLLERATDRVRLGFTLHPQPGYPFTLDLSILYSLGEAGLRVSVLARNKGAEAAPFGLGHHPYLRPAEGALDQARLRIPAQQVLQLDERLTPTGSVLPVAATQFDFRVERPIGATVLDTCYTGFDEAWVELDGARLWWDASHEFVQVFSGDTLSPQHRRHGLAVEPMSCPADAFNSGDGLVVLEPRSEWSGDWGIRPP